MGLGDYPDGYNRNIHGPFDPTRYYGKPDTPFGEVRLVDLPAWLGRRSMNPVKWYEAMSRTYARWAHKWYYPKKAGPAFLYQFLAIYVLVSYANNYKKHWNEMNYKYH